MTVLGYETRAIEDVFQPCAWPCAACGAPLPETAIEVRVWLDSDCHEDCNLLRTEMVCSEGCGIRFVTIEGTL